MSTDGKKEREGGPPEQSNWFAQPLIPKKVAAIVERIRVLNELQRSAIRAVESTMRCEACDTPGGSISALEDVLNTVYRVEEALNGWAKTYPLLVPTKKEVQLDKLRDRPHYTHPESTGA